MTRTVYLELVTDRSTDTFLMAFRFVSLRGNPNNCSSNCGTDFIGAQPYLKELLKDWDIPRIQSAVSEEFSCTFQSQCPSRQSPERNCGESHQISATSVQKPSPQRRAVENVFSRGCMLNKSASSLPKLKRNLGKSAYNAKRPFDRKSFSTSDARSRIESKTKTPHEKYRRNECKSFGIVG